MGVRTVKGYIVCVLTLIALLAITAAGDDCGIGNLGYNSYEGALSKGAGLNKYFGPGVGYPAEVGGDFMRRYVPSGEWGQFGYGTGHLGEGWGPYVYGNRSGGSPRGLFDPLPQPYLDAPPPTIKIKHGRILVGMPGDIPGIKCVTVTVLAFNGAELCSQTRDCPPYKFDLPVTDGVKNVRVRIDYANDGLSATSYPL
jgi:hypothetical protein